MAVYLVLFGAVLVAGVVLIGLIGAVKAYVEDILDDPKEPLPWCMLAGLIGSACLIGGISLIEAGV